MFNKEAFREKWVGKRVGLKCDPNDRGYVKDIDFMGDPLLLIKFDSDNEEDDLCGYFPSEVFVVVGQELDGRNGYATSWLTADALDKFVEEIRNAQSEKPFEKGFLDLLPKSKPKSTKPTTDELAKAAQGDSLPTQWDTSALDVFLALIGNCPEE